jgi:hypothetical protein
MRFNEQLSIAGVPSGQYSQANEVLEYANDQIQGLILAKWKVRIKKAKEISEILKWEDERLIDVRPDLFAWDIAPMINITAHGDNARWVSTPQGGRPAPGQWMNQDPSSEEYHMAIASNYWCEGEHPRSKQSRFAWYRRNAGEYMAYKHGLDIDLTNGVKVYRGSNEDQTVVVFNCGDVWQMNATKKVWGSFGIRTRIGFEINNVWNEEKNLQAWFPIKDHSLKAPVTWSTLPSFGD